MNFEYIAHRINTKEELLTLPLEVGIELDLRDRAERLILQHDPFSDGEDFETFLEKYKQKGTLILNIKSERIEYKVLDLIKKFEIKKYFFLDSSFPMIVKLASEGERNLALRFSEYEQLDTIRKFSNRVKWIWVDCFTLFPLTKNIETELHELGFSICLVSPELQGRQEDILKYKEYIKANNIQIEAICSKIKNYEIWNS